MKRNVFLLVTLMMALCIKAITPTDSQMWWGYYSSGEISFVGTGYAETFDCAIYVPAGHELVGGSTIKAVRLYIPKVSNVSMVKVWISKDQPSEIDNADLVQQVDVASLSDGFNEIELATPYEVNNQAIYVGYSITDPEYCIAVGGEYVENSFLFRSSSSVPSWKIWPGLGALVLQLLLDGGTYPNNYATADDFGPAVVGFGQSVDVPVKITNGGKDPITSISYTISSDDTTTKEKTLETSAITYGSSAKVTIPFEADATEGTVSKTLTITKVNGNDNTASNNTATGNLTTIANLRTWDRHVLIEEFTTEECVFCPDADAGLANFMTENPELASRVAVVSHHAGFYTDWLTIDAAKDYTWFYNASGVIYAPAFMFDRYAWDDVTPVISRGVYKSSVEARLAKTSYAGIDLITTFDGDKLNVTANCERGWDFSSTPIRITLFLTEDNITAQNQSGASEGYSHQHVLRAVNETWGSILDWNDNMATYDYTFNLDPSWKTDDLKVIAFVSGYDSSDPTNCVVENVTQIKAGESTEPITALKTLDTETQEVRTVYYDLTGRQVSNPSNGLFIKAITYKNGKTVTRKVVLR